MTLLYAVLSIFPTVDLHSSCGYSLKIAGCVLGANALGWAIYCAGRQKQGDRPDDGPGNS